jgi:ribose-phosphate pyrophosphokinase
VVADLLQVVGISHVVTVDLHTPQIEGFFHVPVDSLTAVPTLCQAIEEQMTPDLVVASTDVGRAQMAASYAQCLGVPVVLLQKRRESGTKTEVTNIVGDVSGRSCVIVDDIISTGGTLAESIRALLRAGARPDIMLAATHALLLSGARQKLDHSAVRQVFVTDAVRVPKKDWPRVRVISIAPLIARALERMLPDGSRVDEMDRGARHGEKMHATILS